jgi:CHASE2 domain-containing sensor protein
VKLWKSLKNRSAALASMLSACLIGVLLFFSVLGDPLAWLSFDFPFLFAPPVPTNNVVVVEMDEKTQNDPDLNNTEKFRHPFFDRSTHARFLNKLKSDGARLVVFDIFFKDPTAEDALLATAITNHGNVVLGADAGPAGPGFSGPTLDPPAHALRRLPGCRIGLGRILSDYDGVVRTFPPPITLEPRLAVAAAEALGIQVKARSRNNPRYIGYYGEQALVTQPYDVAYRRGQGYFKDKIIFIGGGPQVGFPGETKDPKSTPFSRFTGQQMPGVEIQATMFLNLQRGESLSRLSSGKEFLLILVAGILSALVLSRMRPVPGLVWCCVLMLAVSVPAILIFWSKRIWFDWVLISGVQFPVAWGSAALVYSGRLLREKKAIEKELETIRSTETVTKVDPISSFPRVSPLREESGELRIRDFELLKRIGEGSFGEVWLASSVTMLYRAVKIIFRAKFPDHRPYDREFEGLQTFEPISHTHPGFVNIFHVGKDDARGFFYYVMEAADDLESGSKITPDKYTPKTLGKLLVENPWLSVHECISIGINLAEALGALHKLNLVHRDVKPSNIIFAKGLPKLADIGLVARIHISMGIVGTEGYIPPEGPGTPQADLFSLGRTLYQAATGCGPDEHPGLPTSLGQRTDARDLMRFMEIVNKACAALPSERYQTAEDLRADLATLQVFLQHRRAEPG